MNRYDALAFLPLIKAFGEGATIQLLCGGSKGAEWRDVDGDSIAFSSDVSHYRIKPEPRVIYVNEYEGGALSTNNYQSEALARLARPSRTNAISTRKFVEVL